MEVSRFESEGSGWAMNRTQGGLGSRSWSSGRCQESVTEPREERWRDGGWRIGGEMGEREGTQPGYSSVRFSINTSRSSQKV